MIMNTLNKLMIVFFLLTFSSLMAFGTSQHETPKLTREDVETTMKDMSDAIINGYPEKNKDGSRMISNLALKEIENTYKNFYALPEIEKLTGYSREWFGNLMKIVQELEKVSTETNKTVGNSKQVDKFEQLNKKYEELLKVYKQTYDKPQKPK